MTDYNTDSRGKIWKIEEMTEERAKKVQSKAESIIEALRKSGESPSQAHLILLIAITALEQEYNLEPPMVLPASGKTQ